MTQETNLAKALATASSRLAETMEQNDLYLALTMRYTGELAKLKAENAKLHSDLEFANAALKNAKAALKVKEQMVADAAKDETPFTDTNPEE